MVMVLLFLGVVFLLVGLNSLGSGDSSDSSSGTSSSATTTTATTTSAQAPPPAAEKPAVTVFNISGVPGVAADTALRLTDEGWNATVPPGDEGNLTLDGVTATTVYFGEAPGEKEAADEIGAFLGAPAEARLPVLADKPAGVIVAVTG